MLLYSNLRKSMSGPGSWEPCFKSSIAFFAATKERNTLHRVLMTSLLLVLAPQVVLQGDEPTRLPDTKPLTITEPLDELMVSGIDRFCLRELAASVERRAAKWDRDYSSPQAYAASVAKNRKRFRTIIGAVDARVTDTGIELLATTEQNSVVARGKNFTVHGVRWQVLKGITAEGLLLEPNGQPTARVIALPDADWTPEMFVGLVNGVESASQIPLRLVANGAQVLVPMLISRDDTFSGSKYVAFTNQPHREFVYRGAFQMGRHVIGFEVQKVLAAVDRFEQLNQQTGNDVPIGVAGIGEGGLLALYSAAVDPRIDSTLVSGYFQNREGLWEEPIYRNVWSLLTEFGDAELASLVTPRSLTIEAAAVPEVAGPAKPKPGRRGGAAPGKIETAALQSVKSEFTRAKPHFEKLGVAGKFSLVTSDNGKGPAGSASAISQFLKGLGHKGALKSNTDGFETAGVTIDANERQGRQVEEMIEFIQQLLRFSAKNRDKFWADAKRTSVKDWVKTSAKYRDYVWEETIGKLPKPTMPMNVKSRKVLDEAAFTGYELTIDIYPDVFAGGILLWPKGMKPNEQRPVVVCQHGLEGTPMDTITETGQGFRYYSAFAKRLAERGFITYAPQNPYRGHDRFRTLQRKSNPMKRSLFSYIIRQHERTLEWLSTLPNVDPKRIAFYGLSYGGKTAVRVPPIVQQYALSICSADYDEWIRKNVTVDERYSYMFTGEYEMFEWNMGHVVNYAELATLMTPRPFMVERGHQDGVAPDEWVAWEYSKVRRHYVQLGLGDKTEIEFFNGPHMIHGVGTYEFLHKHLNWPKPSNVSRE